MNPVAEPLQMQDLEMRLRFIGRRRRKKVSKKQTIQQLSKVLKL